MSRSHLTGHQRLAYSPPCSLFPSLVHALTSSLSSPPSKTSTFSPRRLKSRYHPNNITSLCQTSSSDDNTQSSSTNDTSSAASKDTRPNLLKYKSQRSIISGEKRDVTAEEVNQLMVKAGKEARDIEKWRKALKGSFAVVSARLVSGGKLVAFARATSDHALNGTIWDVVTDPELPDETMMKRNIVKYLLNELRRTVPGCSIALFSGVEDRSLFEGLDFVADPDGIRGMALFDPSEPNYL